MTHSLNTDATGPSEPSAPEARQGFVAVDGAELYYRDVGQGQPIIILHGGPDFDHTYLLPDMDRLADGYRLIYYDQRGRGRSTGQPADVSLASELADLDTLRQHLGLERAVLLGHSWGGILGLLYPLRYPGRASHLVLLNTAAASSRGMQRMVALRRARLAERLEGLRAMQATPAYRQGDPAVMEQFLRVLFSTGCKRPDDLARLKLLFSQATIVRGAQVEERLSQETGAREDFDLLPQLAELAVPALIVHGDYDFVPPDEAEAIARAIPGASYVLLPDCGHFAYLEAPEALRQALAGFLT
jgi:proline iminopeptidase